MSMRGGSDGSAGSARWVGGLVSAVLLLVALLHLLWTVSTWPLDTAEDYARLVVGVPVTELPSPGLTAFVAGLLAAAAYLVAALGGVLPVVGPRWVVVSGVAVVAGVLLLRGGGGLVADLIVPERATAEFVRLDRIVYSPLCLLLGSGAAWVLARAVGSRREGHRPREG
jgi:hypothetical protein